MESDIAIKVENVSKTFKIPHEKIDTMRGAFVGLFRKKTYEKFKALDNVSFEVKKGEFFGIIGRNGSGKSTLLKILAGIYQPDNGKIYPVKSRLWPGAKQFNGVQINGRISPFLELGIGFNSELSGRDNIYLNATILGLSRKQIEQKFNEIVAFSELERFIDQKIKNYSSGMQVRLAFSVAIHANRDILLMDEVLAVGDINFQSKCMEEFNKYRDMGKTVVLVTHDIGTVQRHCDRAILIRNGKIEMIGNPQEVGNKYVYQNMSDEEKRILEEEKGQKIKAEKEANQLSGEQKKYEQKHQAEEEKIKRLEEIKEAEEKRNKVAEITKVEFFDKDRQRKNVFETGDDISVRVYFKIHKMKEEFNFGLALYNQENNYIVGINTIFDKIDTKKYVKCGFFQVDFNNIPLNNNSYYALANIVKDNFNLPYALLPKSKYFKVISKNKSEGIVNLNYIWR